MGQPGCAGFTQQKPAGHPQMEEQRALWIQVEQQVLAATTGRNDPSTGELALQPVDVQWAAHLHTLSGDSDDGSSQDVPGDCTPDGFDLGEFGHVPD